MPKLGSGLLEKAKEALLTNKERSEARLKEIMASSSTPQKQVRVQEEDETRSKPWED